MSRDDDNTYGEFEWRCTPEFRRNRGGPHDRDGSRLPWRGASLDERHQTALEQPSHPDAGFAWIWSIRFTATRNSASNGGDGVCARRACRETGWRNLAVRTFLRRECRPACGCSPG